MFNAYAAANRNYDKDSLMEHYYPLTTQYHENKDGSSYFCGSLPQLAMSEYAMQQNSSSKEIITISNIVKASMGKSIIEVCEDEKRGIPASQNLPKKEFKVDATETTFQLSSQLYDELILAVHECKRAEFQSMQVFDQDTKLTKEQYDNVVKIVMDCKRYRLERALQGDDHANH